MAASAQKSYRWVWICLNITTILCIDGLHIATAQTPVDVARLITQLCDESPTVRKDAALALLDIGPFAEAAAPELAKLLNDPNEGVRGAAARALGSMEFAAKDAAASKLAKLLNDPVAEVRGAAAYSLGRIGPSAKNAAELVKLLNDPGADVRRAAAYAIGRIGPAAKDTAFELVKLLKDPDAGMRETAANAIGRIGPASKDADFELVRLMKDSDPKVRRAAAFALRHIEPKAKDAASELVKLLNDPDADVRRYSAYALGKFRPVAEDTAFELVKLLKDPDADVRIATANALGDIGSEAKDAVPELAKLLNDPDADMREAAADALGCIGSAAKVAVVELAKLLKDPDAGVRRAAAFALGRIGPAAENAPKLGELLNDPNAVVRRAAAFAIGNIGLAAKDAAPELAKLLNDPDADVRRYSALALRGMGPAAKDAAPELVKLLNDPNAVVRGAAAEAMGSIGLAAKDAVPELSKLLNDPDANVQRYVVQSLGNIAESLSDNNERDDNARQKLEDSFKILQKIMVGPNIESPVLESEAKRIKRAINHLDALERASLMNRIRNWFQAISFKDWKTWTVIILAVWFDFIFTIFLVKPLWLLSWNEALKDSLPTIKEVPLGIPTGYLSLIGLLAYRPRVLNAWVKAHVEIARENFDGLSTAKDRKVHVASPVEVDGQVARDCSATKLRSHVGRAGHQCRWLIVGEGGSGKTSFACQMARWALSPDKAHRLAPHLMLPVLIEDELDDPATKEGLPRFTEAIRGKLQALVGSAEPISAELLKYLLRRWRVLVVIDHFTEMSQTTRDQIRFDSAEFPAAAFVVTARTDVLGTLPKHIIEPKRIEGRRLSMFLDAYLNERKKRDLFDDEEYFDACLQLSRMTGEREVTLLLAKLYADQMVAAKESPADDELPKTIPDLMLRYLNELNRNTSGESNRTVQRDCKTIAWECMKASYRPGPAERTAVIAALKGDEEDERVVEARLDYVLNRLRVIQVTGPAEDRIRFVLDPLAEYLAGMKVVEKHRGTKRDWERFLEKADAMPGAPENIRGFLLAVRDTCLISPGEVPNFVPDELGRRGGLNPELMQRFQLKQRVRHYIKNLEFPHADDRRHAAKILGELGPEAKNAFPALTKLLKDEVEEVRFAAADALRRIGYAAVAAILAATNDHDPKKRSSALDLLRPGDHENEDVIPMLISAISDKDAGVRFSAIQAVFKIGPAARDAAPALIDKLKDEDCDVRKVSAKALREIGPVPEAIPGLVSLLRDPDENIRDSASWTLEEIGLPAVPALVAAIKRPEYIMRLTAAGALREIGPTAKGAVPELRELLKDSEQNVRLIAAEALRRIESTLEDELGYEPKAT